MDSSVAVSAVLAIVGFLALGLSVVTTPRTDQRTAARLAKIERQLQAVIDHLGVVDVPSAMPEVADLVDRGLKIKAIKVYREATGAGLKEAKDAVDKLARQRGL